MASKGDGRAKAERAAAEMKHEAESIRTVHFTDLWKNHPKDEGARSIARARGGEVAAALESMESAHDSAVRLSIAFNDAGHPLVDSDGHTGKRLTDSSGNVYIIKVEEFKALLTGKHGFGTPSHIHGKDVVRKLGKHSGIILFESVPSLGGGAFIDLWRGASGDSDTATSLGHTYLSEAARILFWELGDAAVTE